jgi:hypothetical protein
LEKEALIIIGNTNPNNWYNYIYDLTLIHELYGENVTIKQVFSTRYEDEKPTDVYIQDLTFSPLELKVIHIKKH